MKRRDFLKTTAVGAGLVLKARSAAWWYLKINLIEFQRGEIK